MVKKTILLTSIFASSLTLSAMESKPDYVVITFEEEPNSIQMKQGSQESLEKIESMLNPNRETNQPARTRHNDYSHAEMIPYSSVTKGIYLAARALYDFLQDN